MRKLLVFFITLILCGVGVYIYFNFKGERQPPKQPEVLAAQSREISAISALIVQTNETGEERRMLLCAPSGCETKEQPSSVEGDALSDGESWYRYIEKGEKKIRILQRVDSDGNTTTITEENPLVRPRGILMSSDGTKIAYFLDNIHQEGDLTELWVYDRATKGTQVAAENLRKRDISSRVRWNASSRVLWFVTEEEEKQLAIIPLSGNTALPVPVVLPWNRDTQIVDRGVMDVSDNGSRIVFAHTTIPGFSQLTVLGNGVPQAQKTIKGNVVFLRWMQEDALLYAVQQSEELTFWMANAKKEWPIARMKAQFVSAHSTGSQNLAAFLATPRHNETHLYVLQLTTGVIQDQMVIPHLSGATSFLVQASEAAVLQDEAIANISSELPDAVLTAFIQSNIADMVHTEDVQAIRMITTDRPNTVYVDYRQQEEVRRILVTVQDAMYPAWEVLGRYIVAGGQWVREEASHGADPSMVTMYEWEEGPSQWILKRMY